LGDDGLPMRLRVCVRVRGRPDVVVVVVVAAAAAAAAGTTEERRGEEVEKDTRQGKIEKKGRRPKIAAMTGR